MKKINSLLVLVVIVIAIATSCTKLDCPPKIQTFNDTIYSAIERIDFPSLVEQDDYYINDYVVTDIEDGDITASSSREYTSFGVVTISDYFRFIYLATQAGERWGWNSQQIENFYRAVRPVIWTGKQKIISTDSGGNTVSKTRLIIGFFQD